MLLGLWLMLGVCSLSVPILTNGSERMIFIEKERSRIKGVQKDNIKSLLDIRRVDKAQMHG